MHKFTIGMVLGMGIATALISIGFRACQIASISKSAGDPVQVASNAFDIDRMIADTAARISPPKHVRVK